MAGDTLGHLPALHVTPANELERAQVDALAKAVQEVTGESVELASVDQGYTGEETSDAAANHGILLEVVKLEEAKRGLILLPRRWGVERSFGRAARFRDTRRTARRRVQHPPAPEGSSPLRVEFITRSRVGGGPHAAGGLAGRPGRRCRRTCWSTRGACGDHPGDRRELPAGRSTADAGRADPGALRVGDGDARGGRGCAGCPGHRRGVAAGFRSQPDAGPGVRRTGGQSPQSMQYQLY
jgi:transposase